MKKRFKAHYPYYVLIFSFALVLFAAIILKPQIAHAEAIFEVLQGKTPDSPGAVIQGVWKSVMTLVNSLVIAVLIFIAFANILRININTYSVKKFLPALVMAILLANFSYLICRLLVDLANVAMSLFINGSGSGSGVAGNLSKDVVTKSPDEGYMKAFIYPLLDSNMVSASGAIQWSYIGSTFFYTIFQFAAAAIMLILALLFYIRNYVIYFLVAMAPLAFASTVLPQTKSLFNMWWSNFWKWTYMPIVSLFWIWLGAQWISKGVLTGGAHILPAAFGIVCFYLALTTPFKMGGGIMQQWGNLGKKAWGATGGKVTDYYKAKGAATWGARWDTIQSRTKELTGIGKGLDVAKEKQARAQRYRKALNDQTVGDWKKKNPAKEGLWEQRMQEMEGSSASATIKGLAAISEVTGYEDRDKKDKDGNIVYKKNSVTGLFELKDGNKIPEKDRIYKYKYAKAAAKAAGAQQFLADKAVWEGQWSALNNDMKKVLFQGKTNPDGSPLSAGDEKKRQEFFDQYAGTLWRAQKSELEATKASGDHVKKLAEERMSIDNIVGEKETSEKILKALQALVGQGKDEAKGREEMTILQRAGYEIDTEGDEDAYQKSFSQADGMITQRAATAQASYASKVERLSQGPAAVGLQDMVQIGPDGKAVLSRFTGTDKGNLERSRTGQYVASAIREGASGMADKYSSRELAHFMQYGAEAEEGLDQSKFKNFLGGNLGANTADDNRKVAEIVRAAARKMTVGRASNPENVSILHGAVHGLEGAKNIHGLGQMIQTINEYYKNVGGGMETHVIDVTAMDQNNLASEMASKIIEHSKMGTNGQERMRHLAAVVNAVKNNADVGFGGSEAKHT